MICTDQRLFLFKLTLSLYSIKFFAEITQTILPTYFSI